MNVELYATFVIATANLYIKHGSVLRVRRICKERGYKTKLRRSETGRTSGGGEFWHGHIYHLLKNPIYTGHICHKGKIYSGNHQPIISDDVWEAAQEVMRKNRKTLQDFAEKTALLTGLVYDDKGERLSPTYTNKSGKRYHYYHSRSLAKGMGDGIRMAAPDLDCHVIDNIRELLSDENRLLEFTGCKQSPSEAKKILEKADKLAELLSGYLGFQSNEARDALRQLVGKVVVNDKDVAVTLKTSMLLEMLGLKPDIEKVQDHIIKHPINYRRLGIKDKLIIGDGPSKPNADPAMIKAIVRAHHWFNLLKNRKVKSIAEIAVQEGLARNYVSTILNLAFLPPELTETVLDGNQEPHINLDYLLQKADDLKAAA